MIDNCTYTHMYNLTHNAHLRMYMCTPTYVQTCNSKQTYVHTSQCKHTHIHIHIATHTH